MRRFLLPLLLLFAPAAPAADVDGLYVGEVPVADQSAQTRDEALKTALGQVLVRVSGDPGVLEREGVADLLARAPDWVLSYGYEKAPVEEDGEGENEDGGSAAAGVERDANLEETAEEGAGEGADEAAKRRELQLRARFDGSAVERALRGAGLPVWGRERPRTLVFLVIEGEADIVSARAAEEVAAAMRETARRRGVPLVFPERGGEERRTLRAADIRYGGLEQAHEAARAYDVSHVLVGRVARVGGGWRGEWSLSHRGETVAEWSGAGAERGEILAGGVRRLADDYARRFAVYGGADADTVVAMAVNGVTAVEDYARVGRYLRGLTAVRTATPVLVDRDTVVFRIQLSGDASVLARSIDLANWLREDELARNLAALYAAGGRALGYRIGS